MVSTLISCVGDLLDNNYGPASLNLDKHDSAINTQVQTLAAHLVLEVLWGGPLNGVNLQSE